MIDSRPNVWVSPMGQQQPDCGRIVEADRVVEWGPIVHAALLNICAEGEEQAHDVQPVPRDRRRAPRSETEIRP